MGVLPSAVLQEEDGLRLRDSLSRQTVVADVLNSPAAVAFVVVVVVVVVV